jgi:hypothetical protein
MGLCTVEHSLLCTLSIYVKNQEVWEAEEVIMLHTEDAMLDMELFTQCRYNLSSY